MPRQSQQSPVETLTAALTTFESYGIALDHVSSWYESPPWPPGAIDDQPVYVNGVAQVKTSTSAASLLATLHDIEAHFGRDRSHEGRNGARTLDLDLIGFEDQVWEGNLTIPHPRMHLRRFVLEPLVEIAPNWHHPVLMTSAENLLKALPETEPLINRIS